MTKYAVGFCFDFGWQNVLLIHKQRPEWQRGKLNGLGGHVREGESPSRAMAREFGEETRRVLKGVVRWDPVARLVRKGVFELWVFAGKYNSPFPVSIHAQDSDGGEVLQVVSMETAHLREVVPNLRYFLPMCLNHSKGLDQAEFFEVRETAAPGGCHRG